MTSARRRSLYSLPTVEELTKYCLCFTNYFHEIVEHCSSIPNVQKIRQSVCGDLIDVLSSTTHESDRKVIQKRPKDIEFTFVCTHKTYSRAKRREKPYSGLDYTFPKKCLCWLHKTLVNLCVSREYSARYNSNLGVHCRSLL